MNGEVGFWFPTRAIQHPLDGKEIQSGQDQRPGHAPPLTRKATRIHRRGSLKTNRVPGGVIQFVECFLIRLLTFGQGPSTHKSSLKRHTYNINAVGVEAEGPRSRSPSASRTNLDSRKPFLKKKLGVAEHDLDP